MVRGWPLIVVFGAPFVLAPAGACTCGGDSADATAEDSAPTDDADSDAGDDARPDVDVAGDSDEYSEADVDGDGRDADADDGVEDEFDADSLLPVGCRFVRPTWDIGYGWATIYSIDAGKFVWRWVDGGSESVLMVRELATGADREVLRRTYPDVVQFPTVHGDSVFFMSPAEGVGSSGEIFQVSVLGGTETRVTTNDVDDGFPVAGDRYVIYASYYDPPGPGAVREYRYVDLADGSEHTISSYRPPSGAAFDGHRWVVFRSETSLYKFDLLDPGAGPVLMATYALDTIGQAFDRDTGVAVMAVDVAGESDDFRLEVWDVPTSTMTVLLDEAWSQVSPDVDGHVVVYQDSQGSGETYFPRQISDLRIVDRDTGARRIVMPLDTYYGVGIWERWIAFNNYGMYGDSLIICDLVQGGFMDAELHVIPD